MKSTGGATRSRKTRFAAAFAALFAFVIPVVAHASGTVTSSVNPIVKWNASTIGTLTLYPNYNKTTGQTNASGVASIISATNGGFTGTSGCTSAPTQSGTIDDFSNVQKPTGTNTTACDYQNAVSVNVSTNSTNWNVSEEMQSGPGPGFTLCGLVNGSLFAGTPSGASPMGASAITGTSAGINETACGGSQLALASNSNTPTPQTLVATQTVGGNFYIGQDILLLVTSSTVTMGSYSDTLTVTLTFN